MTMPQTTQGTATMDQPQPREVCLHELLNLSLARVGRLREHVDGQCSIKSIRSTRGEHHMVLMCHYKNITRIAIHCVVGNSIFWAFASALSERTNKYVGYYSGVGCKH